MQRVNNGEIIAWNEVCTKEKDLYGHVRRDADQRDEESCKHGKLFVTLSNLDSKPHVTTSDCVISVSQQGPDFVMLDGGPWHTTRLIFLWVLVSSPGSPKAAHCPLMPYHPRERVVRKITSRKAALY